MGINGLGSPNRARVAGIEDRSLGRGQVKRAGGRAGHLAAARGRRRRHRELIDTGIAVGIRLFDT